MNPNALKWVEELESGNWEQRKDYLSKNGKHCCLGVACELYQKEVGDLEVRADESGIVFYNGQQHSLPTKVREWLGLVHRGGTFGEEGSLIRLNDSGISFKEIAKVIREEPEKLFLHEKSSN